MFGSSKTASDYYGHTVKVGSTVRRVGYSSDFIVIDINGDTLQMEGVDSEMHVTRINSNQVIVQ